VLLHTQQTDAVLNNANKKGDRQNPNLWPERQGRGHYNRQRSPGHHRRQIPQVSPMPLSRTEATEKPHIVDLARATEMSKLNRMKRGKETETKAHKRLVRNSSYPIYNFNLGHLDDSAQLDQNSVPTQLSIDSNDSQWSHLLWIKQHEEEMEIFRSISLQLEARLQEARAVLPKLEVSPPLCS
jgi:hypothetical protein